jgi:hypothetical protein
MKRVNKQKLYLAIIFGCAAVFLFPKLNALYLFLALAGLVIFLIRRHAPKEDTKFLTMMIIAVVVTRLFLSLLVMEARGKTLTQDEGLYSKKAIIKVYEWKGIRNYEEKFYEFFDNDCDVLNPKYGYNTYTYILSWVYYLFGYQIQAARFINVFFNIIVFLLVFYTAKELSGSRTAMLSSGIFAFFPSVALWSVSVGVDMTALLCITAYMFSFIKLLKTFKIKWPLIMGASYFALKFFRGYAAASLAAAAVLGIAYVVVKKMTIRNRAITGLLIILTVVIFVNTPLVSIMDKKLQKEVKVVVSRQGGFASVDDGGYLTFPNHCYEGCRCSFKDIIKAYANGMRYVLFSPFPWRINSKLQLMAYPQVILWYCMLPFILYGFYRGYRRDRLNTFVIFIYCFSLFSILALAEGNIGGLFRHRDMVLPFAFIFFAVGICDLYDRYFKYRPQKV